MEEKIKPEANKHLIVYEETHKAVKLIAAIEGRNIPTMMKIIVDKYKENQ